MRPRVLPLASLLAAAAGGCGGGAPDAAEVGACLERAGAEVRREDPNVDDQLLPEQARAVWVATWAERRETVVVIRTDDEDDARAAEDALKDLAPAFGIAADRVRREGRFVVHGPQRRPSDEIVDCVS